MEEFFLSLVRMGIGTANAISVPGQIDWNALEDLAERQGLSAILLDGVERLPNDKRPPKMILLRWIDEVLQNYEKRFDLYCRTIHAFITSIALK